MFDNLAYADLILRSFKICNFRNIEVYFRFKTVDLNSLQFHYFICTRQKYISGMLPNFSFEDNGNMYIVFDFNFSGKKVLFGGAYQVLI